jgi:hypothetical protein
MKFNPKESKESAIPPPILNSIKSFKSGGGIYINPKNKGKFTETKERTGKSTEELTHSKNPLTRKRAIFAQNSKRWHHQDGGIFTLTNQINYKKFYPTFK